MPCRKAKELKCVEIWPRLLDAATESTGNSRRPADLERRPVTRVLRLCFPILLRLFRPNDLHRAVRASRHASGGRAKSQTPSVFQTPRAHEDGVGLPCLGGFEQFVFRIASQDGRLRM